MILERTIHQLDIGPIDPERAEKMAQLGYLQWLGALPADSGYQTEAASALQKAQPFEEGSPAVAEFCRMLRTSMEMPPRALTIVMPARNRRGGAQARRMSL